MKKTCFKRSVPVGAAVFVLMIAVLFVTGCGTDVESPEPSTCHQFRYDNEQRSIFEGTCTECGEDLYVMHDGKTGVQFSCPTKTRVDKCTAQAINGDGFIYNYTLYKQKAEYDNYTNYLNLHGCSTCAMTSILNALVPELSEYTPDQVISEIEPEVIGRDKFNDNYDRSNGSGRSPISLYAISKIFDKYGVEYRLPNEDASRRISEITEHLKNGDPVIMTLGGAKEGGLSRSVHTVLLLGIDSEGHVIIGDSVFKSRKIWGDMSLVKFGRNTVEDMYSYLRGDGPWSVTDGNYGYDAHDFYKSKADRGYLLVKGSEKKE